MLTSQQLKEAFPALGQVEVYETLDSTNDRAILLAKAGAPHLSLVLSDSQSHGKGRSSRSFFSPPGTGIYLSLLVRPRCTPEEVSRLTLLAAVATAEAIESLSCVSVKIKWVNDLWIRGKKVTGILTEGGFSPTGKPDYAVIGIGVNVGMMDFPPDLAPIATSVANETGVAPHRDDLVFAMLHNLLVRLRNFPGGDYLEAYRRRSALTGATVEISRGGESFPARVLGIGEKGELLLDRDGARLSLSSGEIAHVTPDPSQIVF